MSEIVCAVFKLARQMTNWIGKITLREVNIWKTGAQEPLFFIKMDGTNDEGTREQVQLFFDKDTLNEFVEALQIVYPKYVEAHKQWEKDFKK